MSPVYRNVYNASRSKLKRRPLAGKVWWSRGSPPGRAAKPGSLGGPALSSGIRQDVAGGYVRHKFNPESDGGKKLSRSFCMPVGMFQHVNTLTRSTTALATESFIRYAEKIFHRALRLPEIGHRSPEPQLFFTGPRIFPVKEISWISIRRSGRKFSYPLHPLANATWQLSILEKGEYSFLRRIYLALVGKDGKFSDLDLRFSNCYLYNESFGIRGCIIRTFIFGYFVHSKVLSLYCILYFDILQLRLMLI